MSPLDWFRFQVSGKTLLSGLAVYLLGIAAVVNLGRADGEIDSDLDGLSDEAEIYYYFTDPYNWDSDGDGESDGYEVNYGYDPLNPASNSYSAGGGSYSEDSDNDGLSDLEEIQLYSTDPYSADTDNDGLSDYDEVHGIEVFGEDTVYSHTEYIYHEDTGNYEAIDV